MSAAPFLLVGGIGLLVWARLKAGTWGPMMTRGGLEGAAFWKTVPVILEGQALPTPGGTPLVRGGRVIGGIGCGGGTGEQDQQCADAGAVAVK